MRNSLSKLQYLLFATLLLAMTGCGVNNAVTSAPSANNGAGAITSKLVWGGKTAGKTVGAATVPSNVTTLKMTVTGVDNSGKPIPVVRSNAAVTPGAAAATTTISGIYPGVVTLAVQALDSTGAVQYEGYALRLVILDKQTNQDAVNNPIAMAVPVTKAQDKACVNCHETTLDVTGQNLVAEFKQSKHYFSGYSSADTAKFGATKVGCAGCHGPNHNDLNPAASGRCAECHKSVNGNHATYTASNICSDCHNSHNTLGSGGCLGCHSFNQDFTAKGNYVNDNSGVRAVVGEFSKRSHHITSLTPHNEQCVVCHLEGKVVGGLVAVDPAYHMKDAKIYLRNADTDAPFVWSGTEHSNVDNFCFSCHDSDGATSTGIASVMTGKDFGGAFTAKNPFADTLTNGYDQVARAGVVDVKTAFTTTNASHHAVSGQRYVYRFSTVENAKAWAARTGKPMPAASEIAEGHTVAGNASPFGTGLTFDPAGPEEGGEATLYEAGKFVDTYVPLGASQSVGDNSTLHCGDCHTVGQWKAGSSTNADGSATTAAIGAHGSNNEYLLRNSLGTDAIHNNLTYVCFNCHKAGEEKATAELWAEKVAEGMIADSVAPAAGSAANPLGKYIPVKVPTTAPGWNALHPATFAGQFTGYATSHAVSAMHIQCLADSADNIGAADRLAKSWEGDKVKIYDFKPAAGATADAPAGGSDAASGNITGIACTNCHNSGLRKGFGGIHGGNNTYTDGLGNTQTSYRFMPGMGNYRYAPPGGWDGKDVSDPSLLTQHNPTYVGTPGSRTDQAVGYPGPDGKPMGGCYTSNGASGSGASDTNDGYSSCSHHGTSTATNPGGTNFRATYGGGTTGYPSTYEPTVREATAGGVLVTRPLKY